MSPFNPASHTRLRKYQLMSVGGMWKARVPYGAWNIFPTRGEGETWLIQKHGQRIARREHIRARDAL